MSISLNNQRFLKTITVAGLIALMAPLSAFAQDGFDVGGALRFNYRYMDWNEANKAQGGELLLDTYRINVDGTAGDIDLSLEYRFYSGYHMLHHGYMGYAFNDATSMQIGVHQVPFGIQPWASHNWFFSLAYYLGLEDDYDAGIKFMHKMDNGLDLQLAYYKNDEGNYTGTSENSSRYSYDLVNEDVSGPFGSNNSENHQFNARLAYTMTQGDLTAEFGISGQFGMLFNEALDRFDRDTLSNGDYLVDHYDGDTDAWGDHMAVGAHINATYKAFNLMLFGIYVEHNPQVVMADAMDSTLAASGALMPDFSEDLVVFGAYDFPYPVASKGILVAVEPAYTVPVSWGPITSLQFYNDFSMYMKDNEDFEDSYHNVTGVLVVAGNVYTYVDVAQGKNNPWLGNADGLGPGDEDAEWNMRFNINIGYYF